MFIDEKTRKAWLAALKKSAKAATWGARRFHATIHRDQIRVAITERGEVHYVTFDDINEALGFLEGFAMQKGQNPSEADELRTLGKRTHKLTPQKNVRKVNPPKKNFFGLGKGAPAASVGRQQRREAHTLLDQGKFRAAKRLSRMSTRKYARKHGIKIEGQIRGQLRQKKEQTRKQVHGLVDRMFGQQNPGLLLPAVVEGLAIGSGIVASEKALEALARKKASKKNPLPALLTTLAEGAESAVGGALGIRALQKVSGTSKRKTMKKKAKKKASSRRPRPRPSPKKKQKKAKQKAHKKAGHNPRRKAARKAARKKATRITHAVAVRGHIVDMGTQAQMNKKAHLLRRAGLKPQIGKRKSA